MVDDKLRTYRRRRRFDRTAEPAGDDTASGGSPERPLFVIQHHEASTDHYDLRLEVDGVLRSWAVPKGPSTDPRDKRLAVPTEDHPLEYADFEGTIAAGEYGGGTVLLWDRGHYTNTTHKGGRALSMAEGLEHGHVSFRLAGEKLTGGYALSRFRTGREEAWLLVKEADEAADARRRPVRSQPESVRTGRRMREIAEEDGGG
ncbi:DNA polymerase ligase N-terminal domain-containing protein [Marinitenerispora sediminis]|uniref:DNA ligase n=1 Tax=Marinitenerispora sediminis TaxID=1931232 RepID=A0A368T490_9ACTN|nr:DNA polymerase ligase N-terminal domain-containing protein [Marinitenerispora sediminis]RCV48964.1 DNA ligase [Marinitenerispora sediminis]RCV52947.1 DNA ligase [Marinitenerispora sediminis]RCV53735.1 DNA ligase [Marinitenerispora sediminis]